MKVRLKQIRVRHVHVKTGAIREEIVGPVERKFVGQLVITLVAKRNVVGATVEDVIEDVPDELEPVSTPDSQPPVVGSEP